MSSHFGTIYLCIPLKMPIEVSEKSVRLWKSRPIFEGTPIIFMTWNIPSDKQIFYFNDNNFDSRESDAEKGPKIKTKKNLQLSEISKLSTIIRP